VWSAFLGQTMVAGVFGLFCGFWLSYAALVLGLNHNWFAIPVRNIDRSIALFLITWAVVMFALTVASIRLPIAYTLVFALVVVALVLLIFATLNADETIRNAAGYVVFAFGALGLYLFLGAASASSPAPGRRPLGTITGRQATAWVALCDARLVLEAVADSSAPPTAVAAAHEQ
jgi:succinate-acetate transporter protein